MLRFPGDDVSFCFHEDTSTKAKSRLVGFAAGSVLGPWGQKEGEDGQGEELQNQEPVMPSGMKAHGDLNRLVKKTALLSLTARCLLHRSPGVSARRVLGLKPTAKHPRHQDCLSNISASFLGLESVSLQGT